MPYYHTKCGGEVSFWARKCKKCGHRWPIIALFSPSVPKGMTTFRPSVKVPEFKRGTTSYAKWADNIPGVSLLASHLPHWPRWLRILAFVIVLSIILYFLRGLLS